MDLMRLMDDIIVIQTDRMCFKTYKLPLQYSI